MDGGRRTVGDQETIDCFIKTVDKNICVRTSQPRASTSAAVEISRVSDSTIHSQLRGQVITLNKVETPPAERNLLDWKEARKAHLDWLVADNHFLYMYRVSRKSMATKNNKNLSKL